MEILNEKLDDLDTPSFFVIFDPDEAEKLGAYQEDAVNRDDAILAAVDMVNDN